MSGATPLATAKRFEGARLEGLSRQVLQGTGSGPLLGLDLHDAVAYFDDRLDGEQRSDEVGGATDAAALFQEIEVPRTP